MKDLLTERSPGSVQRAIDRWGESIDDLSLLHFADLVAGGIKPADAWLTVRPQCAPDAATNTASLLLAHPSISERLSHSIGKLSPRELARTAVPGALQHLYQIATGATGAPDAVRAKAIDSILDRGGLPRTSDISVTAIAAATGAIDRILAVPVQDDQRAQIDDQRAQWDKLLPGDSRPT